MKIQIHQQVLHRKNLSQKLNWLATTAPAAVGGLAALQEHLAGSKFLNISQNVSHDSSAALWLIGRGLWQNQKTVYASFKRLLFIMQKVGVFPLKWPRINWGLKLLCNSQNQTGEWIVGNKPFRRFLFSSEHHSLSALPPLGPVFFQHWPGAIDPEHTQERTGHCFQPSISLPLQLARLLLGMKEWQIQSLTWN